MEFQKVIPYFFELLKGRLPERERRLVAGALAKALPRGGITLVSQASHIARQTIYDGISDIESPVTPQAMQRQRKPGGGRKRVIDKDDDLVETVRSLVNPYEHGNPQSPLLWVSKSLRNLAAELKMLGHNISYVTVGKVLQDMGFTLQTNRKSLEGKSSPDRDEQFIFISKAAESFFDVDQPVISVDAKKKELVGNFKNNGREYHEKGKPEFVEVYDFINENGRATPYGVYDIGANEGYVNVGISHDTAEFAVDTIEQWWEKMGCIRYPNAHSLMINADGGGSNGSRNRLWKASLQKFANKTGLTLCVCHFPPGTSKWNKIEHRMFSMISMNWRGKPLISVEVIVNLIANTTTKTGLKIEASKSDKLYKCGKKVSQQEMLALQIIKADFHPEWNYAIRPIT